MKAADYACQESAVIPPDQVIPAITEEADDMFRTSDVATFTAGGAAGVVFFAFADPVCAGFGRAGGRCVGAGESVFPAPRALRVQGGAVAEIRELTGRAFGANRETGATPCARKRLHDRVRADRRSDDRRRYAGGRGEIRALARLRAERARFF